MLKTKIVNIENGYNLKMKLFQKQRFYSMVVIATQQNQYNLCSWSLMRYTRGNSKKLRLGLYILNA